MNRIIKKAFKTLEEDGVSEFEKFLIEAWGTNPTQNDGRIIEHYYRVFLQEVNTPIISKLVRRSYEFDISDLTQKEVGILYYLRLVDKYKMITEEARNKYISLKSLRHQIKLLKLKNIFFEFDRQNASESQVANSFRSFNNYVIENEGEFLNLLLQVISYWAINNFSDFEFSNNVNKKFVRSIDNSKQYSLLTSILICGNICFDSNANLLDNISIKKEDFEEFKFELMHNVSNKLIPRIACSEESVVQHIEEVPFLDKINIKNEFDECKEYLQMMYRLIGLEKFILISESLVNNSMSIVGWPDLTIITNGEIHLCEVKYGRDKLRYSQIEMINNLRENFSELIQSIQVVSSFPSSIN